MQEHWVLSLIGTMEQVITEGFNFIYSTNAKWVKTVLEICVLKLMFMEMT